MKKTTNYQLTQWSKEDRIMMEDFNRDNAKIDAAIKANAVAISAEAADRTEAITAALSGKCLVASGAYTGTGSSSVSVSCGFRPRLFIVALARETGYTIAGTYNGAFGNGFQIYIDGASNLSTYVGGDTGGKTVFTPNARGISWRNTCAAASSVGMMAMNWQGEPYTWVALG